MSKQKLNAKTLVLAAVTTILSAHTAFALPPQVQNQLIVSTIAGDGNSADATTGPKLSTSMQRPHFIAIRPDGDLLVTGHSEIVKIGSAVDGLLSLYSGGPESMTGNSSDVTLANEHYHRLRGIAYDPFGYIWAIDNSDENILRINEAGDDVQIMVSSGDLEEGDPFDIVSDQFGNIYWSDGDSGTVNRLTYSNPTYLPDLVGSDIDTSSSPVLSGLDYAQGIAFTPDFTTLYVIDQGNGDIWAYYPDNNTSPGSGFAQIVFSNALVNNFTDIVVGPDGSIYVSETDSSFPSNRIWKFAAPTNLGDSLLPPVVYAGDGDEDWVDGPALSAKFDEPYGLAIDAFGNLYVADHDNSVIRMISNVPDFTEFFEGGELIETGDCNLPVIGAALNDIITQIVLSGDTTVDSNGVFTNPTLAALQAIALASPEDQAAFMNSLLPSHIPGMLVATEFVNNKIFGMQSMRSQSIHSKYGRKPNTHGTSTSYRDAPGGVWMEPMIAYLNRSADCCNVDQQAHIDGITVGIDYSVYEGIVLGWSGGKIIDRARYDNRTQKEMIDTYFASPYASASFFDQRAQIELAGIYARNLNKVSHASTDGTIYYGKDQGNTWAGRVAASVKIVDERWIDFAPYAEVEYTSLQTGNHLQLPMDPLSFSVRRHTSAMLRDEAGLMLNWRMGEKGSSLTVSGKVGYVRKDQIQGDEIVLENSVIGDFQVKMRECPRNLVGVGAQLEYEVSPNASVSASYEGEFGDGYYGQSYSASVGGKIRF